MRISVLVPAHNEAAVLRECLDAVASQTVAVDEIVVVADSCTDSTAEVAKSYGAVVVETQQGGKAASQDAGLPFVTGEILVCIDADTVIEPDVIEKFVGELEHGADATCANMLPMPQQRGFWVANRRFAYALGRFWWRWCQAEVGRLMVLSGCAYALRTETVRAIGGFPGKLITCDMDLTWSLYRAGYRTTFCHRAVAYTYDPETFKVYTKQMRRWASGFFQNFQAHKGEVLRSPAAMLVVGSLLLDLLALPVTYTFALTWALHDPSNLKWMLPSVAIHWMIAMVIVTRTITWEQALAGFPCYWIANWWNKGIYLWTFIREWILGRHYMSWTGRQGRATEIAPMSHDRKIGLTSLGTLGAVAVVIGAAASASFALPGVAVLALATAAAGVFALSFLCFTRQLTLLGCTFGAAGAAVTLSFAVEPNGADWRAFWFLGVLALAIGVVGAVLAYLNEEPQTSVLNGSPSLAASTAPTHGLGSSTPVRTVGTSTVLAG